MCCMSNSRDMKRDESSPLYEVVRSSISTRLGALELDEVPIHDRYPVSFQNRMIIGSIFRKYYEMSGINHRRGIFDDLVL